MTKLILLIAAIIFLRPLFCTAQNSRIATDKVMQMHHETIDDPYLPNAYGNKKLSPAYKYRRALVSESKGSSVFTVQVNVDSSGQNILGDAANEPNIAVDPSNSNKMVIGWRQFDNVLSNFRQAGWGYTSDAGQTWTFPGVIEPGVFRSDPVLDYDTSGNFYYNSLTNDAMGYRCKVFISNNGGSLWNKGTDAFGGDKQWMTIDRTTGVGSGNIYSFWSPFYTNTCRDFTRSSDKGNSFDSCSWIDGLPIWGTMAVGNSGELYTAGSGVNVNYHDNIIISKSFNAKIPSSLISWNALVMVFISGRIVSGTQVNPVGLLGQANVDVDRSSAPGRDNVYVLASVARKNLDSADVMFARSADGGLTWSSPMRVNDDSSTFNYQWFGTMSVAPNGRIDAIWLDTRDAKASSDSSALYYSYSVDQGSSWSVNERLSDSFDPHVGYPNQLKMGDYFDMVSDNSGVHLAWANTFNGEQDIYYSHIIPPNGVGVDEILHTSKISVYPNPTKGVFSIKSKEKQMHLEIYTVLGEKIYSESASKMISEIDISSQPAGIYFLKISNRDGSLEVKKIVRD